MSKKKYWQSFGERNNTQQYQERTLVKEFKDDMLVAELKQETLENKSTSRRDFLKYLGFASITATIASSCETAIKRTIPFLNKPQNIVPGEANFYATTFSLDGEVVPVLAKVRDGRPIKIEGNDLSSIYQGGTSAKVQASVLSLYDTARLQNALIKNNSGYEKATDMNALDTRIKAAISNKKIALITNSVSSVSGRATIDTFKKKYTVEHIQYDEISYAGMLNANEKTYGKRAIPGYRFDNAEVIVSIGADFLGTWLSPIEFSKQWSKNRKVNAKTFRMSKHYQIESLLSLTGANADERIVIRPSEEVAFVSYLYEQISGKNSGVTLSTKLQKQATEIAKNLLAHKQKSLVVCDSNDTNVQIVVNAINEALESTKATIDWTAASHTRQTSDQIMADFIGDVKNKKYDVVIFAAGANPVYSHFQGQELATALASIPVTISLNSLLDETAQVCQYILPDNHYLESWGDAEIKTGQYAFSQPTINPLFATRQWQETLLRWSDDTTSYEHFVKNNWTKKVGGETNFEKLLQDGVYTDAKEKSSAVFTAGGAVANALTALVSEKTSTSTEVVFYQKVAIGSGAMANNPWLQEMPDPITKATWDNYAVISPSMAKKLNIVVDDNYEVETDKPVIKITIGNKDIELPVLVIPGTHADVIGIALGYGRTEKIGKAVQGVGKKVSSFITYNGTTIQYKNTASAVSNTGTTFPLAYTQTHNSYEGRDAVMKEMSLQQFVAHPNAIVHEREEEFKKFKNNVLTEKQYVSDATLYAEHEKPGIKWGMSIDLNSCSGCGSCVVACNAENNISVVGKKQVLKAHEMHWIRIDRYFSGDEENPEVVFQPMICQHCDNAPCENVCPVAATNHSSEGLNQMSYNRCIGTRYCANNCPFKVRRFNWLDFNGADSFKNNQQPLVDEGALDEVVMDMNADLTRLVLNPDVTVRARGVIEKCSFCVQRLQGGKIKAKKENRPLQDADIQTACMQACPTNAIVFGNVNNQNSQISKLRNEDQKERVFYALELIHVLPNVNYLAKVRNKNSDEKVTLSTH